jgi:hypothetical protein
MTKTSLRTLNHPPLTKTSTFLGGWKKTLSVPKMNDDDDGTISGKQAGISDEGLRRNAATMTTIWMPLITFITGLTMMFNL